MRSPIDELFAAFPSIESSADRAAMYVAHTDDIDERLLRSAVARIVRRPSAFPPSVGELRYAAFEEAHAMNGEASFDEAFHLVVDALARSTYGEAFEWPVRVPPWAIEAATALNIRCQLEQGTRVNAIRAEALRFYESAMSSAYTAWDGTQATALIGASDRAAIAESRTFTENPK